MRRTALFVSQRDHGLHARRPARGNEAGEHGYGTQQKRNGRKRERVSGCDTDEKGLEKAREEVRQGEAQAYSYEHQPQSLSQHQAQHIGAGCAEGETDADFVGSLARGE